MELLPDDPYAAIELILQLKDDASENTIMNFGKDDKYIFSISNVNPSLPLNDRIRLFPINEYPSGKIHLLATMMGYDKLKEKFKVVGQY